VLLLLSIGCQRVNGSHYFFAFSLTGKHACVFATSRRSADNISEGHTTELMVLILVENLLD
jgi:hypothetical protein